ncbi:MAG: hypothetical protein QXU40_01735 [Candidatus Pacearchaeota archaeon]
MRKKGVFLLIILLIILLISLIHAQQSNDLEELQKVDKAYSCLSSIVNNRTCQSLSIEEKIFSLLSIGKCKEELILSSKHNQTCWPRSSRETQCDLKRTAQAILALSNLGEDTELQQNWLLSQNRTPTEIIWYLQIESIEPSNCTIFYLGSRYPVSIDDNRKIRISNNIGRCLTLTQEGYWFEISSDKLCQQQEFVISCNKLFTTNLLFKRRDSDTVYVNQRSSSAAAEGETREKINSLCFSVGGSCNYEGSLWSAFVLKSRGKDISSFLPYLIIFSDEESNQRFLPQSFLYYITSNMNYKISLLSKQIDNKWWAVSGNRFYDTALALYPLRGEEINEKTSAKEWLLSERVQERSGCWNNNNIVDTGFILASVWPRIIQDGRDGDRGGVDGDQRRSCTALGKYCVNIGTCTGEILNYSCESPIQQCCSVQPAVGQATCSELGGIKCNSSQRCNGRVISGASDIQRGESCCVNGACIQGAGQTAEGVSECENKGGECKVSCDSNEEEVQFSCDFSGDKCCVQRRKSQISKSYTLILILLILIILISIGIIFRNKIKGFLSKKRKDERSMKTGSDYRRGPPFHPPFQTLPTSTTGLIQNRVTPPQKFTSATQRAGLLKTPRDELDEVIRKLKDMGSKEN